jgi:uncharacterized protein YjbI with pentapeptide repeats
VHVEPGGDPLPLDHHIADFLASKRPALINLWGPPGAGKSAALRWLAARFPDAPLDLHDEPAPQSIIVVDAPRIRIHTSTSPDRHIVLSYELAAWTDDDLIEYLLINHRDQCRSVMARLRDASDRASLEGSPALCALVCDAFAADASLTTVDAAVTRSIGAAVQLPDTYESTCRQAFQALHGARSRYHQVTTHGVLANAFIQMHLAAEHFLAALESGDQTVLQQRLAPALVPQIAARLPARPAAIEKLESLVMHPPYQALIVSLLVAADPAWTPGGRRLSSLRHVAIPQLQWTGVDLADLDAEGSNFARGDFRNSLFTGASLKDATLIRARFNNALLESAFLNGSDLTAADFTHATLHKAMLRGVRVEEADFTAADLTECVADAVDWRSATLDAAIFDNAHLPRCNFEDMTINTPSFANATLTGALFTGSRLIDADFRNTCLRNAGLAHIDWPNADLRGADLRGVSFHLGSSRSGLVNSPIASEGSRTGFYTDDYLDLDHLAPEEIRKANLCGADLRGALVFRTDFYLVDLRGARYSEDQARHFANCGAILRSRNVR